MFPSIYKKDILQIVQILCFQYKEKGLRLKAYVVILQAGLIWIMKTKKMALYWPQGSGTLRRQL